MQTRIKNCRRMLADFPASLLLMVALSFSNDVFASGSEAALLSFEGIMVAPGSDSIVLQTPDTYCRDTDPIILTVTGENITWYADAALTTKLAQGNTYYSSPLNVTTTYYLTQNVNGLESPPQAITIEIVEFFLTDVTTTPASCGKNDGTMIINARGGSVSHPLQYKLNDGDLQLSPVFTSLSPGTYKLSVYAANCWGSIDIKVDQRPTPVISLVDSILPHCGNSNGSLRIVAYGGSGLLSYSIDGINFKTDNLFENLNGGAYTVFVKDDSLCVASRQVFLKNSVKLKMNTIEVMPTSCGKSNGQIRVAAAEGNGAVMYSLTGHSDQSQNSFDNLEAGSYQLSAKDEDGCNDTQVVIVEGSEGPVITRIDTQMPTCNLPDGQVTISTGGIGNYYYSLDGRAYQRDSSFAGLLAGTYLIAVKDDSNCIAEQSIDLGEPCRQLFYLPTSFTPNNDGINDGWAIFFPDVSLQIEQLTVYNRWGNAIFSSKPGTVQSGTILWDGIYKGGSANGVFTYRLLMKMPSGQSRVSNGAVIAL
ncbi:gliding motility-associated C-terminal domain-containing protein [Dyadobacter sp. CY327]|uniref:T9SS type B sorting domain-containing protein n=1 Tax=Dyadobacter sp. CY327 TaxID=2907301 RepID=UPI001F2F8C14|nr:gliding motility-associated C-terminal domain-containing protein [Dyadobacter sp. CY327]MCE7071064.1 gliding motility-associated C-terminal domain-containing protein [Dyadobacter sp. CY327]